MQWSTREWLRRWVWKKHAKTQARYRPTYSDESLHDHYGLMRFPMRTKWQTLMKQPGEQPPRAGSGKPARPVR